MKKIALLLLVPFLGALAGALVFASYLRTTHASPYTVSVAGRQRMLAAELRDWAMMVQMGQEANRAGLRSRVAQFDEALAVLERGGTVRQGAVERVPPALAPALAAVASLWKQVRSDLLIVAEAPRGESRFQAAYERARNRLPQLRDLADRFVVDYVAWQERHLRRMIWILSLLVGVNSLVFLTGLWLAWRHIVRPILAVEAAARRIEAGDFSQRLEVTARDELGTLARTFNRMSDEVQRLLAALDLRRKHAETIINSVPAWLLVLRRDLTVQRANRSFRQALGLDEAAVAGRRLEDLLPVPGLREAALEVLASGESKQGLVFELPRQDGTRTLRVTLTGTRLAEEEVLVVVEDVTNDALRQSVSLLNATLEATADGILVVNLEGRIVGYNRQFLEMWRLPEAVMASREDDVALAHVLDQLQEPEQFLKKVRELYAQPEAESYDTLLFKDGRVFERYSKPQRIDGRPVGRVWSFRDVTHVRRAEEALRRSEAELRGLIERAVVGMYRSTPEGRLLMVNPALVEMLGYDSAEELLGVDMATALYQDPDERRRLLEQYSGQDDFWGVEAHWKRKDGTPITVRLSGRLVRDAGQVPVVLEVFVEDVTERLVLEQQLRASQKIQAIGELAGGVAHDFNNLLTTILANSELARGEAPPGSALGEELEAIRQAARSGAELTRKLLAFSRRQRLDLRPVDVGAVVTDFARVIQRMIPEDIQMRVMLEGAEFGALADPGAIEQVLMNLVTNARDAMPSGGTLLVQVRRTCLDPAYCRVRGWGSPGEFVVIEVSDTGVGMDAETKRRLFEPFFTTKPVGQGTGLGMAVVYGIVKQHGGYVDVYSELGQGSTIRVFLPASAQVSQHPAAASPGELRGGTETILLVEDEEVLRRTTRRVLERYGYTVLMAANGAEALELFRERAPDIALVISDVVMPTMGGPELFLALQELGHPVRFLFTSGYTARDVQERVKLPDGVPFIAKPWNVPDFLRKVRVVLDGRS